jgi:hypothetical protein
MSSLQYVDKPSRQSFNHYSFSLSGTRLTGPTAAETIPLPYHLTSINHSFNNSLIKQRLTPIKRKLQICAVQHSNGK